MGCESLMNKAILGSARHYGVLKHYMIIIFSFKCVYRLCGFISSVFFSTPDKRSWILWIGTVNVF